MGTFPKFFRKAIKGVVGGRKLNKRGDIEEFVLPAGDPNKLDKDEITIEINNEEEEKYFLKANKATVEKGIVIAVSDYEFTLDKVNSVSDGELKDMLKLPFRRLQKLIDEFTSPVPVARLLELAKQEDKPVKTVQHIESVLRKLGDKTGLPSVVKFDDQTSIRSV